MRTVTLGHVGGAPGPHDLWGAWNLDPLVLAGLLLAGWAYARGRVPGRPRPSDAGRAGAWWGALAALAVALVSPLDALARSLASAHMVQHLLLMGVAAPLLALSAPGSRILRGSPAPLRRALGRATHPLRARRLLTPLENPVPVSLAHVGALWLWHAGVFYDAALARLWVHALAHATFLVTAVAFWRLVVGPRTTARVSPGLGVLLLFAMTLQSVFLSLLLTFARAPWYESYATTTRQWSLEPLVDQQLAGAIMWVPAGLLYLLPALALLVGWLRGLEGTEAQAGVRSARQPPAHEVGEAGCLGH